MTQPPQRIAEASIEACNATTDLVWRLAQIPSDATCRGAFFNMLDDRAGTLSAETQAEYRRFFRIHKFSAFRMYGLADYLTRLVVLAQIHYGADAIYSGLRELQSGAFDAWGQTLLGRAALAVVDPSLASMLHMLERAYASQTVVSHTRFAVVSKTDQEIVTRFTNEFVYIEHAMVGALEGVARVCRVRADVSAELASPFEGIVRVKILGRDSSGEDP
jgi:uncharacterized protein (TIGR02265 family)